MKEALLLLESTPRSFFLLRGNLLPLFQVFPNLLALLGGESLPLLKPFLIKGAFLGRKLFKPFHSLPQHPFLLRRHGLPFMAFAVKVRPDRILVMGGPSFLPPRYLNPRIAFLLQTKNPVRRIHLMDQKPICGKTSDLTPSQNRTSQAEHKYRQKYAQGQLQTRTGRSLLWITRRGPLLFDLYGSSRPHMVSFSSSTWTSFRKVSISSRSSR